MEWGKNEIRGKKDVRGKSEQKNEGVQTLYDEVCKECE